MDRCEKYHLKNGVNVEVAYQNQKNIEYHYSFSTFAVYSPMEINVHPRQEYTIPINTTFKSNATTIQQLGAFEHSRFDIISNGKKDTFKLEFKIEKENTKAFQIGYKQMIGNLKFKK